jgi:hypothetical protein
MGSLWASEEYREKRFVEWAAKLVDQLGYEPNLKSAREYWDEALIPGQTFSMPRVTDVIHRERQSPVDIDRELSMFTDRLRKELPNGSDPVEKTAREYFLEGYSVDWAAYCEAGPRLNRAHAGDSEEEKRHYWNCMR